MTEKWLVCGGAGFIGSAVVKEARNQDIECWVYDKQCMDEYTDEVAEQDLEIALKDADVALSFIAIPRIAYCQTHQQEAFETNVLKNVEIMNLCLKYDKPFVFASSAEVLSNGHSFYKKTKKICERIIKDIMPQYMILRYSHVFGKDDPHSNRVITRFLRGEFEVYNYPNKTFDFTYLSSVAKKTVQLVKYHNTHNQKVYNVFSFTPISLHDVITKVFKQDRYQILSKPDLNFESTRILEFPKPIHPDELGVTGIEYAIKDGKLVEDND